MRNAGVWAGFLILGYSIVIFYQSLSLEYTTRLGPGPGFFPRWLSGGLMLLALIYIWDSLKHEIIPIGDVLPRGLALSNILYTIGGLAVFILIVDYTGFVVAGSVMLYLMLRLEYKWYTALCASIATSIILLFVFQSFLGVTLPVNEYGF